MTILTAALLQLVDQRKRERRQPMATLSRSEAEAQLFAIKYTGSVIVEYANGIPQEYGVCGARIVLDKTEPKPDSKSGI